MDASIDVGTNTVRLLVGRDGDGRVEPKRYYRRITRLGGGFSSETGLAGDAMDRTFSALEECGRILREEGATRVKAVGTAALRAAANGPGFVQKVRSDLRIPLQIIGGDEEARLSARGVMAALAPLPERSLIFDIGGGSTEFIFWRAGRTPFHRSYPLGVVRLSESGFSAAEQQRQIDEVLGRFRDEACAEGLAPALKDPGCPLVGTAGTVTTLAALHLEMVDYDWRRVNNLCLSRPELQALLPRLETLSVAAREALPGMEEGRGDLIVPGLRIVLGILQLLERNELVVSDFGLLEGALLSLNDAP
jgi:exopolyphosphatase/guanosine-5'-triphosphate,3'-diphosphate pyrophosphatase